MYYCCMELSKRRTPKKKRCTFMYRRGICRLPLCFFCSLALPSPFRSSLVLLQLRDSCTGCVPINLGTGMGYSVMEVVKGMEEASGKPVPYKVSATL